MFIAVGCQNIHVISLSRLCHCYISILPVWLFPHVSVCMFNFCISVYISYIYMCASINTIMMYVASVALLLQNPDHPLLFSSIFFLLVSKCFIIGNFIWLIMYSYFVAPDFFGKNFSIYFAWPYTIFCYISKIIQFLNWCLTHRYHSCCYCCLRVAYCDFTTKSNLSWSFFYVLCACVFLFFLFFFFN